MFNIYKLLFLALKKVFLNGQKHSSSDSHQPIKQSTSPSKVYHSSPSPYSDAVWKTLGAFEIGGGGEPKMKLIHFVIK